MPEDVKDFEAKVNRITEIVSLLEKGGLPLAESIALYEEGVAAISGCEEMLRNAKLTIERLGSGGEVKFVEDSNGDGG